MKSVLALLGSGISRPSGLPGVREITADVLNRPLGFGSDKFFDPPPNFTPMPGLEQVVPHTQNFLRLLKAYADRYYAVRSGQESHYEDIYYLARQIADDQVTEVDNPAIDGFIREVRVQAEPLLQTVQVVSPGLRFHMLARRACNLIEYVVACNLTAPERMVGLDLLAGIAGDRTLEQVDLVTLNHDLLVEQYLRGIGEVVTDGFVPFSSTARRFHPEVFDAPARLRLLKLHGSIDWHRYRDAADQDFIAVPVGRDPEHVADAHDRLLGHLEGPLFLAGTFNKLMNYGTGIFAEQFFRFHQFIKQHDRLVVSGYGFNDKGVNARLWDWLYETPARRLLILHQHPEELLRQARGSLTNAAHRFEASGRLVFEPRWMQDTEWSGDVKELLA